MTAASITFGCDEQQRLELGRRDLVALVLDELLDPVDDREVAALVVDRDVAGVEEAVGVERLGGRLGLVEVAEHDVRALDPQLAGLRHAVLRRPR